MERWRFSWRAVAARLPAKGLRALRRALIDDDPRLVQNATAIPDQEQSRAPVLGACAIGFCGWQAGEARTAREVFLFLARVCFGADDERGYTVACDFLAWFDETDRAVVLRELLPEVERELRRRGLLPAEAPAREACCAP